MPSRQMRSLWPRDLGHQCARLQSQTRSRPLDFSQRSLCTLPTNPRDPIPNSQQLQNSPLRRQPAIPQINAQSSRAASRLARMLGPGPGQAGETYVAYGMTQQLFRACSREGEYTIPQLKEKGTPVPKTEAGEDLGVGKGWFYEELGLVPTFSTWSQITFLHMYILTVRLRALPSRESFQTYSRHLIDHFSHDAENRMDDLHGLTSRGIRNKFLKDLFIQWRGVLAAYDEGLIKGDAVLGAAVWRNLWKASYNSPDGGEIEWEKVARVVAYMRRVISELSKMDEADLIFNLSSPSGPSSSRSLFSPSDADVFLVEKQA